MISRESLTVGSVVADRVRFLVAPVVWWIALRVAEVRVVHGMKLVDFKGVGDPASTDSICSRLAAALECIEHVAPPLWFMVTRNIRAVVRTNVARPRASYHWHVYKVPYSISDWDDTRRLAAHLVSAAKFLEVLDSGNACTYRRRTNEALRQANDIRDCFEKLIATPTEA